MEENRALIGALIFIGMIVGANLFMYAIVRGATRSNGGGFIETLNKALNTNPKAKRDEMEELHSKLQELNKGKNNSDGDTE